MSTQTTGIFGADLIGAGYFGHVTEAAAMTATVISTGTIAVIEQLPGAEVLAQVAAVVTVGGVDISDDIESITVTSNDSNITGRAQINFIGAMPPAAVEDADVDISVRYLLPGGATYQASIFSGTLKSIVTTDGSQPTAALEVVDSTYDALNTAPATSTISGSATTVITTALTAAGVTDFEVDITDYTVPASTSTAPYQTVRDMVAAVSGGLDDDPIWLDAAGKLHIEKVGSAAAAKYWTLPKSAYCNVQTIDDPSQRYQSYTVQGLTGLTATATGTGTMIGSETSPFLTAEADLQTKADAVVARAERTRRTMETVINALAKVGLVVTVTHTDDITYTARIFEVVHTLSWPAGFWTQLGLEVIP